MRSFVSRKTFAGLWEEDMDSTISFFETLAMVCGVTSDDKLRAIPIMFSADDLIYYASHITQCRSYEDTTNTVLEWYSNADKRSRILVKF